MLSIASHWVSSLTWIAVLADTKLHFFPRCLIFYKCILGTGKGLQNTCLKNCVSKWRDCLCDFTEPRGLNESASESRNWCILMNPRLPTTQMCSGWSKGKAGKKDAEYVVWKPCLCSAFLVLLGGWLGRFFLLLVKNSMEVLKNFFLCFRYMQILYLKNLLLLYNLVS